MFPFSSVAFSPPETIQKGRGPDSDQLFVSQRPSVLSLAIESAMDSNHGFNLGRTISDQKSHFRMSVANETPRLDGIFENMAVALYYWLLAASSPPSGLLVR
jgi:hypothetical protein